MVSKHTHYYIVDLLPIRSDYHKLNKYTAVMKYKLLGYRLTGKKKMVLCYKLNNGHSHTSGGVKKAELKRQGGRK